TLSVLENDRQISTVNIGIVLKGNISARDRSGHDDIGNFFGVGEMNYRSSVEFKPGLHIIGPPAAADDRRTIGVNSHFCFEHNRAVWIFHQAFDAVRIGRATLGVTGAIRERSAGKNIVSVAFVIELLVAFAGLPCEQWAAA